MGVNTCRLKLHIEFQEDMQGELMNYIFNIIQIILCLTCYKSTNNFKIEEMKFIGTF